MAGGWNHDIFPPGEDSAPKEADVMDKVYEAMRESGLDENQIINVVNALHNKGVVFRWADYLTK